MCLKVTCVQIFVGRDSCAAWRMGGAWKTGTWETRGYIKGMHSMCSYAVQACWKELGGRLIASYAVVPPVLLLPHALCLLQTALDSLLSLLPLPPCS